MRWRGDGPGLAFGASRWSLPIPLLLLLVLVLVLALSCWDLQSSRLPSRREGRPSWWAHPARRPVPGAPTWGETKEEEAWAALQEALQQEESLPGASNTSTGAPGQSLRPAPNHRLYRFPQRPGHCLAPLSRVALHHELGTQRAPIPMGGRISSLGYKGLAEFVYGDMARPDGFVYTPLTNDTIPCMRPGAVVFVETAFIRPFIEHHLAHITVPFVLVTADSFYSSLDNNHRDIFGSLLVIHWYSMNCDMHPDDVRLQGRVTCLPLGNSQWDGHREAMDRVVRELGPRLPHPEDGWLHQRDHLLLASFSTTTNPKEREPALRQALNAIPLVTTGIAPTNGVEEVATFYRLISQYQFVLSPHGRGLDCYRTWEALYLGCIPVVKTSTIDSLYRDLPVLILRDWSELTEARLRETWAAFSRQHFNFRSMYLGYWERRFYAGRLTPDGQSVLRHAYPPRVVHRVPPRP